MSQYKYTSVNDNYKFDFTIESSKLIIVNHRNDKNRRSKQSNYANSFKLKSKENFIFFFFFYIYNTILAADKIFLWIHIIHKVRGGSMIPWNFVWFIDWQISHNSNAIGTNGDHRQFEFTFDQLNNEFLRVKIVTHLNSFKFRKHRYQISTLPNDPSYFAVHLSHFAKKLLFQVY